MSAKVAIEHIGALVDSYHALNHPPELGALWRIRRDLVAALATLTKHVKQGYGNKAMAYAIRKHETAKEILAALENDRKDGKKATAFTTLTVRAEALNSVLEKKEKEIAAEAEWEEILATIKMVDKALFAMSQEITDGMQERQYQNYLAGLQAKDIADNQPQHEYP